MPRQDHIEIFKSDNGQFYWRRIGRYSEIIASSEGFKRKKDAVESAAKVNPGVKETVNI